MNRKYERIQYDETQSVMIREMARLLALGNSKSSTISAHSENMRIDENESSQYYKIVKELLNR